MLARTQAKFMILNDDGFSGFAIPNDDGQSRARVCGKSCVYYADQTKEMRACVVQVQSVNVPKW